MGFINQLCVYIYIPLHINIHALTTGRFRKDSSADLAQRVDKHGAYNDHSNGATDD